MPLESHQDTYGKRIQSDLLSNILPFWQRHAILEHSPYVVGSVSNDLVRDLTAPHGMLLTARVAWTFSAAYRRFDDEAYKFTAEKCIHDLSTRFLDDVNGGYFWSLNYNGRVINSNKYTYGHAFAIYALCEYFLACGSQPALAQAMDAFKLLEGRSKDPYFGGYLETRDARWAPVTDMRLSAVDQNSPKSQNSHLHLIEAYTSLYICSNDIDVKAALTDLIEIFLSHIVNEGRGTLELFFSVNWSVQSSTISYGHNIEASWLLTRAAEAVAVPRLEEHAKRVSLILAAETLAHGLEEDGGLKSEPKLNGAGNTTREWWQQAEAVVGFLNAYQLSRNEQYLRAALNSWDFIEETFIDYEKGEWFRAIDGNRRPSGQESKVGFWKCPYHNGRCALEATKRLATINSSFPKADFLTTRRV